MINGFKKISIRGRVAFSISCLEAAILKANGNLNDWKIILNQLWKYTEDKYLDEWHEITAEFIPDTILGYRTFNDTDFEYLSRIQFNTLSKLYKNNDKHISELINIIFEIGTVELYGSLINGGIHVLEELENIINLMKKYEIPLPNFSTYENFSFDDENGWGKTFNKREIEKRY